MSTSSIYFHIKDYNLLAIQRAAHLNAAMVSRYRYFIYGLKNVSPKTPNNQPLEIEVGTKVKADPIRRIAELFRASGLHGIVRPFHVKPNYPRYTPYTIYIGLRRDLREHVSFCACMIETIVLGMEGRVAIDAAFKIPNVPKLAEVLTTTPAKEPAKVHKMIAVSNPDGDNVWAKGLLEALQEPQHRVPVRAQQARDRFGRFVAGDRLERVAADVPVLAALREQAARQERDNRGRFRPAGDPADIW